MAITVDGGIKTAGDGVDKVLDAPQKLVEGDIGGALRAGFDGQREVKKGLLNIVGGVLMAPIRLLTGNTERGSEAARAGTQAAVGKRVG